MMRLLITIGMLLSVFSCSYCASKHQTQPKLHGYRISIGRVKYDHTPIYAIPGKKHVYTTVDKSDDLVIYGRDHHYLAVALEGGYKAWVSEDKDILLGNKYDPIRWPDNILKAIHEKKLLMGMTQSQVMMSKGLPFQRRRMADKSGISDTLFYQDGTGAILRNKRVIQITHQPKG